MPFATTASAGFAVIGGSIVYRMLIATSLRLGIAPTDLKLLTAVLAVVALAGPHGAAYLPG